MPAPAPAVSMADDLVFDVFSRLPVKSLCRFRCVSRGWHALISDPAFLAAHRARHTEPHFVVADHFGGLRVIDMDANVVSKVRDVSCSRVLSTSMDDLICLTKCRNDFAQVMDPATGKVLMYWPKQHDLPHMLGFGRAVPSGAYKIVYLGRDCMVLTLGDDIGWRVAPSPPGHQGQNLSSTIVVNGVMYVLVSSTNCRLLCFDLETEEWKKALKGPRQVVVNGTKLWKETMLVRITELNSTLCMVLSEMKTTNIWLLIIDSDEEIWFKMYTIPITFYAYLLPLWMTPDGDRLIFCCLRGKQGQVIQVYDSPSNACSAILSIGAHGIKVGMCSLHLDRFVLDLLPAIS
jgi:F-box interacting protein